MPQDGPAIVPNRPILSTALRIVEFRDFVDFVEDADAEASTVRPAGAILCDPALWVRGVCATAGRGMGALQRLALGAWALGVSGDF
jgi:hypothetical protein